MYWVGEASLYKMLHLFSKLVNFRYEIQPRRIALNHPSVSCCIVVNATVPWPWSMLTILTSGLCPTHILGILPDLVSKSRWNRLIMFRSAAQGDSKWLSYYYNLMPSRSVFFLHHRQSELHRFCIEVAQLFMDLKRFAHTEVTPSFELSDPFQCGSEK